MKKIMTWTTIVIVRLVIMAGCLVGLYAIYITFGAAAACIISLLGIILHFLNSLEDYGEAQEQKQ